VQRLGGLTQDLDRDLLRGLTAGCAALGHGGVPPLPPRRSLAGASAPAQLAAFDVGLFFRDYVADLYVRLPTDIELAPPTRTGSAVVWTDSSLIRSIVDNLIRNAIDAVTEAGGGTVGCDWLVDPDEGRLLLEVRDNGIGMTPDQLQRVLAGAASEGSRKEGGSGIGMLTVLAAIHRLGGEISGASTPGEGTTWTVELPAESPLGEAPDDHASEMAV
jgi:signal transduction histidine kinase